MNFAVEIIQEILLTPGPTDLADEGKTIQIQAVSGHLTSKEVERYTRITDRARNARAAMAGKV